MIGTVYLVGAGPGDPSLITVGGADALKRADVVVYDRLAHPKLLDYAPAAEHIYAGKQADRHALTQDETNAFLAERAMQGQTVVRLKGGDPFVFGRGGEEAQFLRERNIPFVVIPGVTSAIAAPAYAGIPVTHRDKASSFAVITGHERADGRESGTRDAGQAEGRRKWENIAHAADTLLFLMGVESLDEIAAQLLAHDRAPETPVALVRWGTWAGQQETLVSTLSQVVNAVRQAQFKAPAVLVVGEVVTLRDNLRWWDNRPLSGKRIVVTRAREQASEFAALLAARGAEAIEFPLIKIVPPPCGYGDLDAALASLERYEWACFASAPAVRAVFDRLREMGKDARAFGPVKVAAVGPATADALREMGIAADFVPSEQTGAALGEQLPDAREGTHTFVPRALDGDDGLIDALAARGTVVNAVTAYANEIDGANADAVRERLQDGTVDAVTFTSSSTVRNFAAALGTSRLPPTAAVVCIGPSTAQTAAEVLGRVPAAVAEVHTVAGLINALEHYFSTGTTSASAADTAATT